MKPAANNEIGEYRNQEPYQVELAYVGSIVVMANPLDVR
jgi:hypothetical protein